MHNFRTPLLVVLLSTLSSPAFAQDSGSWPAAPGQAPVHPYPDPYRRGYSYLGPDYTCPRQSVVVGMPSAPPDHLQAPASTQQGNDRANREIASAPNASPAPASPASRDAVRAQAPDANPSTPRPYALLTCGTFVRLEFLSPISSKTAQVGDPLTLRVTDDIKAGEMVIVPRGTLADGNITFVRRTGPGGMPGALAYQLNALHLNGRSVPLWRVEGRSGDPKVPGAETLLPVAGAFTLFRHGKDVELKPGLPVTAFVAADTTLALP
jgi:hypothetical protein